MMIRYLEQDEKETSRDLYEAAFTEDSQAFIDFYYQVKCIRNRILVKEDAGLIRAMVHLNPYSIMLKKRIYEVDYIVAVATSADSRHQGHMRDLLTRALLDNYNDGMPFMFLMPAAEAIYRPFDFRYMSGLLKGRSCLDSDQTRIRCRGSAEELAQAGQCANRILREEYEMYCIRNRDYMEEFWQEISSENGWLDILMEDGEPVGLEAWWGSTKSEQRELLLSSSAQISEYAGLWAAQLDGAGAEPVMMGRIVDAEEFVKNFGRRKEVGEDQVLWVQITDSLIPQNSGIYRWTVQKSDSVFEKQDCPEGDVWEISIADLGQWLFGFGPVPESCKALNQIVQPLRSGFFDEVV